MKKKTKRSQHYMPVGYSNKGEITDIVLPDGANLSFEQEDLDNDLLATEYAAGLADAVAAWVGYSSQEVSTAKAWLDGSQSELEMIAKEKSTMLGRMLYRIKYGEPDKVDWEERSRLRQCEKYIAGLNQYMEFADKGLMFIKKNSENPLLAGSSGQIMLQLNEVRENYVSALKIADEAYQHEQEIAKE